MSKTYLASICIPVLNEEENVEAAYERVKDVFNTIPDFDFEIVFTDNRSTDRTFEIIQSLSQKDPRVRGARFSKNVGFQNSILTNYFIAKGDVLIQLDCDLQDPPELIPQMIDKWREGYDVVYGIRTKRQEGRLITFLRKLFYRGLNFLAEEPIPVDVGDFRLIDRRIVTALKKIDDKHIYIRGVIARMGFNQHGFEYERDPRMAGETKFKPFALFSLATDALVANSLAPLRFASYLGLFFAIVSILFILIYIIAKIFGGAEWPPGFATLMFIGLLNLSVSGFLFGIFGAYLGRTYSQTKDRPISIIDEIVGENIEIDEGHLDILNMSNHSAYERPKLQAKREAKRDRDESITTKPKTKTKRATTP